MPSGKTARKQRRVPPPPVRQSSSRRASPKVLLIAGGVLAAVAIGVVLAVTLGGGGSSSPTASVPAVGSLTGALPGAADVQRMFTGIPQAGNTLGATTAPVTMVEYVDLQCPYCKEFETSVLPNLLTRYVRPGKLRIEQRLLAFIGPDSVSGRSAALAAGFQDKQFNFSELLYFNQGTENTGWLDDAMANAAAASIPGLDVDAWSSARGSSAVTDQETQFDNGVDADNVTETPTVLVGRTGGKLRKASVSLSNIDSLSAAIENALG
jgi:protein-disulfide isomerase